MEILAFYLLKIIGLQALLFGLYWLICRNCNRFHFNRYFLLSTLLLPFIIPLFKIRVPIFPEQISTLPALPAFDAWSKAGNSALSNIVIEQGQVAASGIAWWIYCLVGIYLIVAVPFAFRLIKNYIKIHGTIRQSTRNEITPGGFKLFYIPSKIVSFSFLNWIFLSDLFTLKTEEKNIIVAHEEYHLKQRHSLDIILAECIRILCWFNPIILLIQKNLKDTHEFLTDRYTVNQFGKNEYGNLLRSYQYQEINMMLGHAYSSSSIQNRIKMMETKKSPAYKIVLLCAVTILTSFLFACETSLNTEDNKQQIASEKISDEKMQLEINQTLERIKDAPEDFKAYYKKMQLENPDIYYKPTIQPAKSPPDFKIVRTLKNAPEIEGIFAQFRILTKEESAKYFEGIQVTNPENLEVAAMIMSTNRAAYFRYREKKQK